MLDLNQLALFIQVVQAGSFARAARRLSVPPTTLSRQVAQLENALQVRLLQRSTRKLSLTDVGRTLYDQSAAHIALLQEAGGQLLQGRQTPVGSIRVAAAVNFFDFFAMEWIEEFLTTYPGVRVEFMLSDTMADFIEDGIDVAFRGSAELPDSSLVARKLGAVSFVVAASPAYLAARGTPRKLAELAAHDCVVSVPAGESTTWRLIGQDGPASIAVTGRFSANTGQAQKKAAISNLGICLLPRLVVQDNLRSGELVEVLPGAGSTIGNLYVVYPSRRYVPIAATAFVAMAVQRLADLIPKEP